MLSIDIIAWRSLFSSVSEIELPIWDDDLPPLIPIRHQIKPDVEIPSF